ncbi:SpvB/TcaC N-terminal domain-containing protein [Paenibacillus durus]|uniref:SpvB/TcaC N-terminal domain-containing protein n=1 Tax=Paenibacillus durus TaxID=44251 RepID=UPI0006944666|nr:SpvB/TcaC N-terminal domain-containing protein [Paenibacillus durus]
MIDNKPSGANMGGQHTFSVPSISLPKGGGAIRGISEKFAANPVTGAASMAIPLAFSPGRSGFGPQISLQHDSGIGNGPFGFGWTLSIPSISRKTDKGLPRYQDAEESDVFLLSGAEDLVPVLRPDGSRYEESSEGYTIHRYRPRIEGTFARIERWTDRATGQIHWCTYTPDNAAAVYGRTENSQIADPDEPAHVYSWLLCESRDDKGNAALYEYAEENDTNVDFTLANESNRMRTANRYLKRVKYGNRVPLTLQPDLNAAEWLFEAVFDYEEGHFEDLGPINASDHAEEKDHIGEQRLVLASLDSGSEWAARPDPFSFYRAGFEVRTYRRCRRMLMFHRFAELGSEPCLVRSTEFEYADFDYGSAQIVPAESELAHQGSTRAASFLRAVTQSGYIRDESRPVTMRNGAIYVSYIQQSMPPVEFEYSKLDIRQDIRELEPESIEYPPPGFGAAPSRWVDLDREGLPGILTEHGGGWFYKPNLGGGRFGPQEIVAPRPAAADLLHGRQGLLDIEGNGRIGLAVLDGPAPGVYERTGDRNWEPFSPFRRRPNISWDDPNLCFIDLDGDGRADVLITENEAFTWYPSLGKEGFGPARSVRQPSSEEPGPRLVLADGEQSIYLADLSGDGLTDLVRIRNGEICYWPNRGYGRFGAKVVMDGAPRFDLPGQFDQARIRLADLDGSGITDLVYFAREGVRLYFNQSGNRWSIPVQLDDLPLTGEELSSAAAVDLLGNGTACLVWSSSMPGEARRSLRYIDLTGGRKPHLLVRSINNLGGETEVQYAPSTAFYLADKLAGRPWATKLPLPVHVVERVETRDHITGYRFVNRYVYHHGYFDGDEREFRGFAMVERLDTESWTGNEAGEGEDEGSGAAAINQPPVTTRTWYHTGACFDRERVLHQLRGEYYRGEPFTPESMLPPELDDREWKECLRALKGLPLRREVYSFDGSEQAPHPYSAEEHNYEIRLIQRHGEQRHAVCLPIGCESLSVHYERNPEDPRIAHMLNLETDEYGNSLKSCSVVYGRSTADPALPAEVTAGQQRLYIAYAETDYTADIDRTVPVSAYRLRAPFESRSYEITGLAPATGLFRLAEIRMGIAGAAAIPYEAQASGLAPQKRLLSRTRTVYADDHLNPLPPGRQDTLGLVHQSFRLAFTPGAIATCYVGNVSEADCIQAGYVHLDGDENWWIRSGTALYPTDPAAHFYIPIGMKDLFGVETNADYDGYDLLVERVKVKQVAWNESIAVNDYRVLGAVMLTDPNKNRAAVEMDALGVVVKSAAMGKEGGGDGDSLDDPTIRVEYDLYQWMKGRKPNYVRMLARELHGPANPRWQESYVYSDGNGSVVMIKRQANPGKALRASPGGIILEVDANPRWIGSGRTILNNKGNPVKQYEPYFSATHEYEDERGPREIGVTPILYYDPLGRNLRTEYPNGTYTRVEFDPWHQKIYDANDTVTDSGWYAKRGSPDPAAEPEPQNNPERRAAWLAAKHANTPGIIRLDSLGRPFYTVTDYGGGRTAAVRSESDLTGRLTRVFDQLGREAASGFVSMAGSPVFGESAEKGRRWIFQNAAGAIVRTWDEQGRHFRTEYDSLQRPVGIYVQEAGQSEILFSYMVYGDRYPDGEQLNLLGAVHQIFDQAGMVRLAEADFKGNPKRVERILSSDYSQNLNWDILLNQPDYTAIQAAANAALDTSEVFRASADYDALNRPTLVTLPDRTVVKPVYNEASVLASLSAQIGGQGTFIEFLKEQDYDAKGRRLNALYGNEACSRYFYDPKSFRLLGLVTFGSGDDPNTGALQNLHYSYDPVGNITHIKDEARQTHYFNNAVVHPDSLFEYDAAYQLIRAAGREHAGGVNDGIRTDADLDFVPHLPHSNNTEAVRRYTEEYEYDLLGNITVLRHRYAAQAGIGSGWTRRYKYGYENDAANSTNRLVSTSMPGDPEPGPYSGNYNYDAFGNMTKMPHLVSLSWNFLDQLQKADLGGGGMAHYVYDLGGQRIRKVIERGGNLNLEWIYLGAVLICRRRRRDTGELRFERWTVHLSDNTGIIARADTKTRDEDGSDPANPLNLPLIRYLYSNHLGSAVLETDEDGNPVSYEEYHPYGTTAYRLAKPGYDLSLKRYRFSGKERDEETGLYYFGARYYAPWLGRWTSSDPAGFAAGLNLYRYCSNNPVMWRDPNGTEEQHTDYLLKDLGLEGVTDPKEFSSKLRASGYDFTGYDDNGKAVSPDASGKGVGLAKRAGDNWDVGRWLKIPGTGDGTNGQNSSPGAGKAPPGEADSKAPPPDKPKTGSLGSGGTELSLAAPEAELFIWKHSFKNEGLSGSRRGFILQNMYTNNPRVWQTDNVKDFDFEPPGGNKVQQIKSTDSTDAKYIRQFTRDATRAASDAVTANPTGTMAGKRPQAVMIAPTDAPKSVETAVDGALAGARKPIPNNPLDPQYVRGLPGLIGTAGKVLTVVGTGLSAFSLGADIARGDAAMGVGDALGTVGGGLEIYAMTTAGATVAGFSALTVGVAIGGLGIAVTSGVSGYRAYQAGDMKGAVAGGVGVLAGLAIAAGAIGILAGVAGAPLLLAAGAIAAIGVGIFHAGRFFDLW